MNTGVYANYCRKQSLKTDFPKNTGRDSTSTVKPDSLKAEIIETLMWIYTEKKKPKHKQQYQKKNRWKK